MITVNDDVNSALEQVLEVATLSLKAWSSIWIFSLGEELTEAFKCLQSKNLKNLTLANVQAKIHGISKISDIS